MMAPRMLALGAALLVCSPGTVLAQCGTCNSDQYCDADTTSCTPIGGVDEACNKNQMVDSCVDPLVCIFDPALGHTGNTGQCKAYKLTGETCEPNDMPCDNGDLPRGTPGTTLVCDDLNESPATCKQYHTVAAGGQCKYESGYGGWNRWCVGGEPDGNGDRDTKNTAGTFCTAPEFSVGASGQCSLGKAPGESCATGHRECLHAGDSGDYNNYCDTTTDMCTPRLAVGETCTTDTQCLSFDYGEDSVRTYCILGVCSNMGDPGDPCEQRGHCKEGRWGATCDAQVCVANPRPPPPPPYVPPPPPPPPPPACQATVATGGACSDVCECAADGDFCQGITPSGGDGTCTSQLAPGAVGCRRRIDDAADKYHDDDDDGTPAWYGDQSGDRRYTWCQTDDSGRSEFCGDQANWDQYQDHLNYHCAGVGSVCLGGTNDWDNTCASLKSIGQACTTPTTYEDEPYHTQCSGGFCHETTGLCTAAVAVGQSCTSDYECGWDARHHDAKCSDAGVCTRACEGNRGGTYGSPYLGSEDCAANEYCDDQYMCAPMKALGESCGANEPCSNTVIAYSNPDYDPSGGTGMDNLRVGSQFFGWEFSETTTQHTACIAGTCGYVKRDGDACDGDNEFPEPNPMSASSYEGLLGYEGQCLLGSCASGTCTVPSTCTTDAECGELHNCDGASSGSGQCLPKCGIHRVWTRVGDDGQTVVECAEGWYCEDSVSSCYERVGLGGACSQDKACGDDLYCKESVCVTGLASGEACSRSTQCEGFRYDLNQDDPDQMVCKDDSHEVVGLPSPTGGWIFPEGTGTCQCGGGILCLLTGRFFVPFLIVAIFFACLILCSCKMICCRSKPKPPAHLEGSEKVGVLFFQDKIGNPQGKDGPWKFGPVRQCCGRSYPECEGWKDGMPLDEGAKALLTGIDEHVNKAEQQGMFGKTPARESVKTNLEAAGWLDKLNVELGKQSFEAHFDQCQGPILTISIWRKGSAGSEP